jgi:histidyl-tRNA synthetase
VRGLDYYTRTTFEVTSGVLGAQNSVLGGGRYDGLVKDLGGPDLTGIGFALGMERLILMLPESPREVRCGVFVAPLLPAALDPALLLQRALRQAGLPAMMEHEPRVLKAQLKRADKLGARYVVLIGEAELAKGAVSVRDMGASAQEEVAASRAVEHLKEMLQHGSEPR